MAGEEATPHLRCLHVTTAGERAAFTLGGWSLIIWRRVEGGRGWEGGCWWVRGRGKLGSRERVGRGVWC